MADNWNIGRFLAHRVTELGVHDFFVVPGDYNLILLDHMISNPRLRMVNCCNELNTGYAADGYARSHPKKIAVVVVTYMVGSLSILNAIAGAYSEGLRVIVICGGPPSESYNSATMVHHSLGLADKGQSQRMFDQVTCASVCLDRESTAGDIDRVLQTALCDSRPVYIEIPVDLSFPNASFDPATSAPPVLRPAPTDTQCLNESADAIRGAWKSAQSPVIVIGGAARGQIPRKSLDQLVSVLGCVVFYLPDGKSLVSETLPQCGGLFWSLLSDPGVESTVKASDLWITIGCRWNDLHTLQSLDLSSSRLLSIHGNTVQTPDGKEIPNSPMPAVVDQIIQSNLQPNPTSLTTLHQNREAEGPSSSSPQPPSSDPNEQVSVDTISETLSALITPNDAILSDAGQSWFTASQIRLPPGAQFHLQLLYASTGWSLPACMGSERARNGGRVFAVIGDGSLQMVCQELSTMARNRVNAIILIINNCGYQVEDAIHQGPYNEIGHWDYVSLVEAMWKNTRVQNARLLNGNSGDGDEHHMFTAKIHTQKQLNDALHQADQSSRTLAVLECCVDPDRVSSALQKFGSKLGHTD